MAEEVVGNLLNLSVKDRHVSADAAIARSKMAQRALAQINIPLIDLRVWDAFGTLLPTAASSDDLGLITQTFGTTPPNVQTSDAKTTTVTQRARFLLFVPEDYDAAEDFKIRAYAGMQTTVANGTATIDFEAYKLDNIGSLVGPTDLVTTSATSINSLTHTSYDFALTTSSLTASAVLDVRVTIAITDSGTGTAVIGRIDRLDALVDIR